MKFPQALSPPPLGPWLLCLCWVLLVACAVPRRMLDMRHGPSSLLAEPRTLLVNHAAA